MAESNTSMSDISDMLNSGEQTMSLIKKIGSGNANKKFARHMHERAIESLKNKQLMIGKSIDSDAFSARHARFNDSAQSVGDIRSNSNRLRAISSNLNSLNSQVV